MARSAGSWTARAMFRLASRSTRPSSSGRFVNAWTCSSLIPHSSPRRACVVKGELLVQPPLAPVMARSTRGITHGGVRWKRVSQGHVQGLNGGHDLDGGGARADHGDALAAQVVVVVPAGRVEDLPGEGVDPRYVGDLGMGSGPVADTTTSAVRKPRLVSIPPELLLVPRHHLHLGVEAQMRAQPEDVGDVLQVGPDVLLPEKVRGQWGGARTRTSTGARARAQAHPG